MHKSMHAGLQVSNNGKRTMSNDLAIYLSKQLLWQALLIASPIILAALVSGLLVSILQVVTQIQDSSLSFVPKILAVVLMLMLCGGWMLHSLVEFAQTIIINIPGALKS
ncbi:MAG: flagellar biosynthesis protein FliQ [Legionella sp.]|uniref:flagellar biosynthesis protein FliQ n=1 Tax=Legionella sp. TaxID=459 RepID=UPI0039E7244B